MVEILYCFRAYVKKNIIVTQDRFMLAGGYFPQRSDEDPIAVPNKDEG